MTFDDLKQLNGQMIQYYEVRGNKVTPKTARVRCNGYNNTITLVKYDKLGRQTNYDATIIYLSNFILPNGIPTKFSRSTTKRVGESSMISYTAWGGGTRRIYLQKEDAYNMVINKLREERRNVDKKMLALQKEMYTK